MNLIWLEDFKSSVTQIDHVERPFISLRWHLNWLPRVPFDVYRVIEVPPSTGIDDEFPVFEGFYRYSLSGYLRNQGFENQFRDKTIARVKIDMMSASAIALTVRAVNEYGALDEIVLTKNGTDDRYLGILTAPGMTDLEIICDGKANISGIDLWLVEHVLEQVENGSAELLEQVGLPIEFGAHESQVYDNSFVNNPLDVLNERFSLATQLGGGIDYQKVSREAWGSKFGNDLLKILRNTDDSTLDNSFEKATVEIHDIPLHVEGKKEIIDPETREPQTANSAPVLFNFLSLGAATYSPLALTFGYGTNIENKQGYSIDESFYVVVASAQNKPYIYNHYGSPDIFVASVVTAIHAPPSKPSNLAAKSTFLRREENTTNDLYQVSLSWDRPDLQPLPLSYRVVDETNNKDLTEENGPFYLPADLDQEASEPARFNSNPIAVKIREEETIQDYSIAATDVHDRWSDDVRITCAFTRRDAQNPVLKGINHEYLGNYSKSDDVVKATFYIELSWNWDESLPKIIEVKLKFPPEVNEHLIRMTFETADHLKLPTLNSESLNALEVQLVGPSQDSTVRTSQGQTQPRVEHNIQTYRITVSEQELNFDISGSTTVEASVHAQEQNRVKWSEWSRTLIHNLGDPRPAAIPEVIAQIYYTEAPDLTKWARITWPFWETGTGGDRVNVGDARIRGYAVYEASEQALLVAGGEDQKETLQERANALQRLHDNSESNPELRAVYSRKYPELISPSDAPTFQLEVPENPNRLYVFRCSSVTHANVESELSNPVFVAIPKRVIPSAPVLSRVKVEDNTATLKLRWNESEEVDHIKLYRVQNDSLKEGSFGPAHKIINLSKHKSADIEIKDDLTLSWRPYQYRAIASADGYPSLGRLPGQSEPSNLVVIEHTPRTAPKIRDLQYERLDNGQLSIRFKVVDVGTFGKHRITLRKVLNNAPLPVESVLIDTIYEKIKTAPKPRLNRFSASIDGEIQARIYVAFKEYPIGLIVSITDPLGRSRAFPIEPLPPEYLKITSVGIIREGWSINFECIESLSGLGEKNTSSQLIVESELRVSIREKPIDFGDLIEGGELPTAQVENWALTFAFPLNKLEDDQALRTVATPSPAETNLENHDILSPFLDHKIYYKFYPTLRQQGVEAKGYSRYRIEVANPTSTLNYPFFLSTEEISFHFQRISLEIVNGIQHKVMWVNRPWF